MPASRPASTPAPLQKTSELQDTICDFVFFRIKKYRDCSIICEFRFGFGLISLALSLIGIKILKTR